VVEDQEDARASLALLLRLWGHQVREACDGPAALALAASFLPQVALLDLALPGLDGCRTARQLRQLPGLEQLVLVALTGSGRQQDRDRCDEAGYRYYLLKPYDPQLLRLLLIGLAVAGERRGSDPA
jgi:CheY-like chemotaxis protein